MKLIKLTDAEYEELIDILRASTDEGPGGMGWQSQELQALIANIEAQAEEGK